MSLPDSLAAYVVILNQSFMAPSTWDDANVCWLNMKLAAESAAEHLGQQRDRRIRAWFLHMLTKIRRDHATLKIRTLIAQHVAQ